MKDNEGKSHKKTKGKLCLLRGRAARHVKYELKRQHEQNQHVSAFKSLNLLTNVPLVS